MNEWQAERTQIDGLGTWIPAKIHCSGGTARSVRNLVHRGGTSKGKGVGWDEFLKGMKYRGQDVVGAGGEGGLERISDSTQRFEIAPDSSRNQQRIGIMTGDTATGATPPGRAGVF